MPGRKISVTAEDLRFGDVPEDPQKYTVRAFAADRCGAWDMFVEVERFNGEISAIVPRIRMIDGRIVLGCDRTTEAPIEHIIAFFHGHAGPVLYAETFREVPPGYKYRVMKIREFDLGHPDNRHLYMDPLMKEDVNQVDAPLGSGAAQSVFLP